MSKRRSKKTRQSKLVERTTEMQDLLAETFIKIDDAITKEEIKLMSFVNKKTKAVPNKNYKWSINNK